MTKQSTRVAPSLKRPRIGLTPRSVLQSLVLQRWAEIEGRSVADLCLTLLEQALREAARNGDMPLECVEMQRDNPITVKCMVRKFVDIPTEEDA